MKMVRNVSIPEQFAVLKLATWKEFATISSISFSLGLWEPLIRTGDQALGGSFRVHGRLDVHYPCDTQAQVQILIHLYDQRELTSAMMNEAVESVLTALQIPQGESYSATFVVEGQSTCIESDLGGFVTYAVPASEEPGEDD